MDYIVLGLLLLRGMTIYELNTAFKQGLSLIYSSSYGALQNAVKKLQMDAKATFVTRVENGRNKKIYSITDKGRDAFFAWMTSEIPMNKLETVSLARVFFLGQMPDKESKLAVMRNIIEAIEQATDELSAMKEELSVLELPPDQMRHFMFQFKTLDYGVMSHRSGLKWMKALYRDIEMDRI